MDKNGKKLTEQELIDILVAWYKLDKSTEELRQAAATYIHQNDAAAEARLKIESRIESRVQAVAAPVTVERVVPGILEDSEANAELALTTPTRRTALSGSESSPVAYQPQYEPTDELIGTRRVSVDVWALYYATEEFFHKVSFGILNMQALAFLFCVGISAAVIVGAWQSSLSTERQKKAAYKSMVIAPADGKLVEKEPEKELANEIANEPDNAPDNAPAKSSDKAIVSAVEKAPQPTVLTPTPVAPAEETAKLPTEPVVEPSNTKIPSSSVASAGPAPEPVETSDPRFGPVLQLMEQADWDRALATMRTLEEGKDSDLQPLLTMLKVEALIRKRDTDSMELARQLLMDCKYGEYDTVYDLLVARWMLLCSMEDRKRFLSEAASLPESARRRMSSWAQIRNGSKDALTEVLLETTASKGQSEVCDLLFIASFHFNVGKMDETIRELLDTQLKLRALQATGKSKVESWLLDTAKSQLVARVDDILAMIKGLSRKSID
ncbi:MAG: hypothetical protein SFV81_03085 [Pirellulaceae bacterium]|nr:hypothetical protein [Pirellulaceae bacterium]